MSFYKAQHPFLILVIKIIPVLEYNSPDDKDHAV